MLSCGVIFRSSKHYMIPTSEEENRVCGCNIAKPDQSLKPVLGFASFCCDKRSSREQDPIFEERNYNLLEKWLSSYHIKDDTSLTLNGDLTESLALSAFPRNQDQLMLPEADTDNIVDNHIISLKSSMYQRKSSLAHSTQQSYKSNSVSMRKNFVSSNAALRNKRPSSAALSSDDRGINLANSCLYKSNQQPLPSSSSSTLGNKSKIFSRPKSAYRHQWTNMHVRPVNALAIASTVKAKRFGLNEKAPIRNLTGDVCVFEENSFSKPFGKISSKKSKPVFLESVDKSNEVLSGLDDMNRLSLTVKPISLANCDEERRLNHDLNSRRNSSGYDGLSSFFSFCTESAEDDSLREVHSLKLQSGTLKSLSGSIESPVSCYKFPIKNPSTAVKAKRKLGLASRANSGIPKYLMDTSANKYHASCSSLFGDKENLSSVSDGSRTGKTSDKAER